MNTSKKDMQTLVDRNPGDIIHLINMRHATKEEIEEQQETQSQSDLKKDILHRKPPICLSKGQHPKQHACLPAKFAISPELAQKYRVGIFRESKTYDAWIRFSSSAEMDDRQNDVLGLAIKLKDVTNDGGVQDFLLINRPIFFASKVQEYIGVLDFLNGAIIDKLNALKSKHINLLKNLFIGLTKMKKKQYHPLSQTYWSAAPFKHGEELKVKYILEPVNPAEATKANDSHSLSEFIASELNHDDAVFMFNFFLHVSDGTKNMPVDILTEKWDESINKVPVATLKILGSAKFKQNLHNSKEFGEKLSFSPGNCLPEHEPLGELNIIRKHVYAEVAKKRRQKNWGAGDADALWPIYQENPIECPFHQSE